MDIPTENDFILIQDKKYAVADVYIDLEACGGPYQSVNGTRSIGMHVRSRATGLTIFEKEWYPSALADIDCKLQTITYWNQPQNRAEWGLICSKTQPRLHVIEEIRDVMATARKAGWTIHLLARPAPYDFRELTAVFQTAGIEILSQREDFNAGSMAPADILAQICAPFDLRKDMPTHFDARNMMASPFGFGGATQVTDIGQQINGAALVLGINNAVDFRKLLQKVLGRELTHNGLQDARDQADVWIHFQKLIKADDHAALREFLQ